MIAVANRLAERSEVDLVLVRRSGPFLEEVSPKVRIIDLKAGKIRKGLLPLNTYMRREKPRLMVSAGMGTDVLGLIGKIGFRWPVHLHISFQNTPTASEGMDEATPHWPLLIKTFYRFASSISAISQGVARDVERLLKQPPGSVPVINNPVDIDVVRVKAAEPLAHPWFSDSKRPLILAVGRLVRQKDFPTLLTAFGAVRRARPDARLVILGEGPDREALEAEIMRLGLADSVSMPGFTTNPFSAMAGADLFVLSSRWEGFANVVAEALACGTNVVSTDCPSGPAEILEDGRWGRLAPVGDADALCGAILAALEQPLGGEILQERANAFALESIAEEYRLLFRSKGIET